ncbi:MAG: ABC transporter ATP-binding protein [Campylobacterales bacterium]|nr:ABC transporter ATP-binding protein [Campylobacterales bacterium]
MIRVIDLFKEFTDKAVLHNISLEIDKGVIFGLLGPNGAGKTTLIKTLCGILKASSGDISIDGESIENAKPSFGYVAQHFGQYEELSVWENILFYAKMYSVKDIKRLKYLMERYGLEAYKSTLAGKLSGGYQRRLALVCALVHNPKVLFLDEPTAGIDPITRKLLWDDFYTLALEGKTLFVTTHYMEEAQRCNQLAFLASGKLLVQGTPEGIKESIEGVELYSVKIDYNPELISAFAKFQGVALVNQFGDQLRLLLTQKLIVDSIEQEIKKYTDERLLKATISLEDVFIYLTQEFAE